MTSIEIGLEELSEIKMALGQYLIEIRAIRNDIGRMERNVQEIRESQNQELSAFGRGVAEDIFRIEKSVRENKKKHPILQNSYKSALHELRRWNPGQLD